VPKERLQLSVSVLNEKSKSVSVSLRGRKLSDTVRSSMSLSNREKLNVRPKSSG
jgi:hypothetical protein